MHRSRISVVLVDHPAPSYDAAADFWSAVVGVDRPGRPGPDDPYEDLGLQAGAIDLALQLTTGDEPARVHLDVETDDVDAEVARLEALGGRVVERRPEGHVIMADPGGLALCVVPVFHAELFERHARRWG